VWLFAVGVTAPSAVACNPPRAESDPETSTGESTGAATTSTGGETTTTTGDVASTSLSSADDSETTTTSEGGRGFIDRLDGGPLTECDIWAQDCRDGEKCNPCPGVAEGQQCVPLFEEGQAPEGHDDVGGCLVPQ
jgi:hypothetical protein